MSSEAKIEQVVNGDEEIKKLKELVDTPSVKEAKVDEAPIKPEIKETTTTTKDVESIEELKPKESDTEVSEMKKETIEIVEKKDEKEAVVVEKVETVGEKENKEEVFILIIWVKNWMIFSIF